MSDNASPAKDVTLSDGSVWRYDDELPPHFHWMKFGLPSRWPYPHILPVDHALTADDHRAIADVLDPPADPPKAGAEAPAWWIVEYQAMDMEMQKERWGVEAFKINFVDITVGSEGWKIYGDGRMFRVTAKYPVYLHPSANAPASVSAEVPAPKAGIDWRTDPKVKAARFAVLKDFTDALRDLGITAAAVNDDSTSLDALCSVVWLAAQGTPEPTASFTVDGAAFTWRGPLQCTGGQIRIYAQTPITFDLILSGDNGEEDLLISDAVTVQLRADGGSRFYTMPRGANKSAGAAQGGTK